MKCLNPQCNRDAVTRGLCRFCYESFSVVIRSGMITWEDAVTKGYALDAKKPNGRPHVLSDDELLDILKEKFPDGKIPNRRAYIEAIGGNVNILSIRHKALLDWNFPEMENIPNCR